MEISMKVPREVILDLLPLYAAGEASQETCALVDEYLKQDPEMRQQFNLQGVAGLTASGAQETALPIDLELKSLRRTRSILRWQRRLYGWALAFTIASLGGVGYIDGPHFVFHFFFQHYPGIFWPCASIAFQCWVAYFVLRWRFRSIRS